MYTKSTDKIEKALRLQAIIDSRKALEKEESELKDYFKNQIKDGFLEAGPVLILIEHKSRSFIDRKLMTAELGEEVTKSFERVTEYDQVTVKARA